MSPSLGVLALLVLEATINSPGRGRGGRPGRVGREGPFGWAVVEGAGKREKEP